MTRRRTEIEAFVRDIVARIEAAEAQGIASPAAIADHFNETGLTTRKGRGWTAETVRKFLASPGAKRYRRGAAIDIRETTDNDLTEVLAVVRAAFGSDAEADLTRDLLADPSAAPRLSLLASENGCALGHILFTRARIEATDLAVPASLLCPLSVHPDAQKRGIGQALIASGIRSLTDVKSALVFVFGDPAYYGRHGFEPASPHGLIPPYPISDAYADAWMVQELRFGALRDCAGAVACADTLHDPVLWAV